jgi:hypothetical protein
VTRHEPEGTFNHAHSKDTDHQTRRPTAAAQALAATAESRQRAAAALVPGIAMSGADIAAEDQPFFDFAQSAQDLLRHQLEAMRAEDPATHATLVRAPAVWRVTMTLMRPTGQVLVHSEVALPSGEVIALQSVEFQPRPS